MEKKIFIHIPKNGGMTIRRSPELKKIIIQSHKENHISEDYSNNVLKTMNHYNEHPGYEHARWRDVSLDLIKKYKSFAIVRNPWSKVVSRYTFLIHIIDRGEYDGKKITFEEFLEERNRYGNIPYFWHRAIRGWYQQKDHVTDSNGDIKCDILRFENFVDDTMRYFKLNKPLTPRGVSNGKVNKNGTVTPKKNWKEYYDRSENYDIVKNWYQEDIDFFGFTFDHGATNHIWNNQ